MNVSPKNLLLCALSDVLCDCSCGDALSFWRLIWYTWQQCGSTLNAALWWNPNTWIFQHNTHLESSWNAKKPSRGITMMVAAASRCSECSGKIKDPAPTQAYLNFLSRLSSMTIISNQKVFQFNNNAFKLSKEASFCPQWCCHVCRGVLLHIGLVLYHV